MLHQLLVAGADYPITAPTTGPKPESLDRARMDASNGMIVQGFRHSPGMIVKRMIRRAATVDHWHGLVPHSDGACPVAN